jgi:hypothetical protein
VTVIKNLVRKPSGLEDSHLAFFRFGIIVVIASNGVIKNASFL